MAASLTIFEIIAALLLVMAVGWVVRRAGVLTEASTLGLGRIVADVCFPVLCFKGLVDAGAAALSRGWLVPMLGFVTLAASTAIGLALARVFCERASQRPTFAFCVAVGNWIFIPLPIAHALYGSAGTATVLLHNAGAQVFLWTFGILTLRGGRFGRDAIVGLARNPGLWATALGIAFALGAPSLGLDHLGGAAVAVAHVLSQALGMVGGLTIPLVTLAIGAQLAEVARRGGAGSGARAVFGVTLGRLAVAPAFVIGGVALLAARAPGALPDAARWTEYLIAAMPVSLSTGALVQRYDGDVALSSRSIALTTVLSVITVPLVQAAASGLGLSR